jgi:hypothetical protein
MSSPRATVTGELPARVANATSDVIHLALRHGMETDEITCIVVTVAADYARLAYGDAYLTELAKLIEERADAPAPNDIGPLTS